MFNRRQRNDSLRAEDMNDVYLVFEEGGGNDMAVQLRLVLAATLTGSLLNPTRADNPFETPPPFATSVQQARIEDFAEPAPAARTAAQPASSSSSPASRPTDVSTIQPVAFDSPQPASFEQRFMELEAEWKKYKSGVDKKKSDAAKKPTYKIGGRIHVDHWGFANSSPGAGWFEHPSGSQAGTDPEDRFLFRRIRVETKGDIFESMLYDVDIDFATPGVPEMKDAYLGFKNLPNNQELLFGSQKRPLGLDHLNSSRFNVFIERPMVVDSFNDDARRLGVAMYGYTDDEQYHWRYGVYNLDNIKSTGKYIGDSLQLSLNGRLSTSPWYDKSSDGRGYLHLAVAGMLAHPDKDADQFVSNTNEGRFRARPEARTDRQWIDTGAIAGADWYEIAAFESILNIGALQITGEYQTNWVQRRDSLNGTGPDVKFHGGYIYVAYFLTGEHVPYSRKTGTIGRVKPFENFFLVDRCDGERGCGWGAWQVAARYSYLDLTDKDILGGVETNWTFGLNWWWTSHSHLQFNLIYGEIENHKPVGGFDNANFVIAGTRFAVDF